MFFYYKFQVKYNQICKKSYACVGYIYIYRIYQVLLKLTIKKVTNEKITSRNQCNCKNKNDCPLDGNCQTTDIIYECTVSTTVDQDKIYLGTAEGDFKKDIIIIRHHSKTEKRRMTPPSRNMYGK